MPVKCITDGSAAFTNAFSNLSRFVTPHRPRKNERKAFDAADFDDVHRSIAERQYEYIGWPRSNSVRVRSNWFGTLAPSDAYLLGAANIEARINFAKIAVHEVLRQLEGYEGPVSFFSVCPRRYVMPLCDAHMVDLYGLKKLTGQVFAGCSLVGSTDFALFKGFGKRGIRAWHNQVGAHTHGLVWGKSAEELQAQFDVMGPDFINVKGTSAGYIREIGCDEIAGYMRYSLKLPLFEYNVTADDEEFDPETGEIIRTTKLSSNPLRSGDQLRMAALLHDMSLDHLIFGQHEGTAVAREIRRRARLPLIRRNEDAVRQGRSHGVVAINDKISRFERTAISTLIENPPERVWLGPKPSPAAMGAFLGGNTSGDAAQMSMASLPELVMN